jgi:hypothetical protein
MADAPQGTNWSNDQLAEWLRLTAHQVEQGHVPLSTLDSTMMRLIAGRLSTYEGWLERLECLECGNTDGLIEGFRGLPTCTNCRAEREVYPPADVEVTR